MLGSYPRSAACPKIRAGEGYRAVGFGSERNLARALGEKERRSRIARCPFNGGGREVFLEVLIDTVGRKVDGHHAEAAPEDPFWREVPGESDAGLEVVEVPLGELALRVRNGSQ